MMKLSAQRSKIVCTIGPASDSAQVLGQMIRAGMNVARLNLAHGTPEEHRARIGCIRAAAAKIVTPTETGTTAARIARFRLMPWILALSPHHHTCQRLCFYYGVHAVAMPSPDQGWEQAVRRWLVTQGIEKGLILLTQGPSRGHPGGTNRLEIIRLEQAASH
ncbi:MAG: pyruvate kinase [Acidithiobacillus sp.]